MSLENIIELVSQVGFPIVMVLWFAFRNEKIVKENTEITREMSGVLKSLHKRLDRQEEIDTIERSYTHGNTVDLPRTS